MLPRPPPTQVGLIGYDLQPGGSSPNTYRTGKLAAVTLGGRMLSKSTLAGNSDSAFEGVFRTDGGALLTLQAR